MQHQTVLARYEEAHSPSHKNNFVQFNSYMPGSYMVFTHLYLLPYRHTSIKGKNVEPIKKPSRKLIKCRDYLIYQKLMQSWTPLIYKFFSIEWPIKKKKFLYRWVVHLIKWMCLTIWGLRTIICYWRTFFFQYEKHIGSNLYKVNGIEGNLKRNGSLTYP